MSDEIRRIDEEWSTLAREWRSFTYERVRGPLGTCRSIVWRYGEMPTCRVSTGPLGFYLVFRVAPNRIFHIAWAGRHWPSIGIITE